MTRQEAAKKAAELVSKMTVEEKISQLIYTSPEIERLGIKEHNWWNEALHGVARAGKATVFPQAIALAATFDKKLVRDVADAISTEGRAKYNQNAKKGSFGQYKHLTYWSPNINIFRDPRWGRGQETYGEDPYLTAQTGVSFIKGIQGDGEFYKAAACAKHFAAHSGPEGLRHGFDAKVSKHDVFETYLPAFEKAVQCGVEGVMGAYNRTNGEPCCASKTLIEDILFKKWGFEGYFVSDCGAIKDIWKSHKYTSTMTEAAALSLKSGCHLNCGEAYDKLFEAYEEDIIDESDIDKAAIKLFTTRFLLGEFEEKRPFSDIPPEKLECQEHKALNLEAAMKSQVLLKNENSFLPLDKTEIKSIAVIGPNAQSEIALEGNYNGKASKYITVLDGIREVFDSSEITYKKGCSINKRSLSKSSALKAAEKADLTILCLGIDRRYEGEEGEEEGKSDDYTVDGDKKSLFLPKAQLELAEEVCEKAENIIAVVLASSSMDIGEKLRTHAKAIIHSWYPGSLGGLAIAKILAGEYNPSGKLPLTFYFGNTTLPDFSDYSMKGRTYRYFNAKPLYPFGFGLSYTSFEYSDFKVKSVLPETVSAEVTVKNTGKADGEETVQVYASFTDSRTYTPNFQLCGYEKVFLKKGEEKKISVSCDRYFMKAVLENGERVEPNGEIKLFIGGHQPDKRSGELCGDECSCVDLQTPTMHAQRAIHDCEAINSCDLGSQFMP